MPPQTHKQPHDCSVGKLAGGETWKGMGRPQEPQNPASDAVAAGGDSELAASPRPASGQDGLMKSE